MATTVGSFNSNWSPIDFQFNEAFWAHWGNETAIPFRILNLATIQEEVSRLSGAVALTGRTLRDALNHGELRESPGDALMVSPEVVQRYFSVLRSNLEEVGFKVIRQNSSVVTLCRFNRFVDLIAARDNLFVSPRPLRVHGVDFGVSLESQNVKSPEGEEKIGLRDDPRNFKSVLKHGKNALGRRIIGIIQGSEKPKLRKELRELSETEFLSLHFEHPTANNWSWRFNHLNALVNRGELLSESLDRLSSRSMSQILNSSLEVPMGQTFTEPINLSREFWNSGNNFFTYPFLFGFRHQVMPYSGANLYILAGIKPALYSKEYFELLPKMSDAEIRGFLEKNPLEISDGSLTSGRHRASAMLGRLWRGEGYLPIFAEVVIPI